MRSSDELRRRPAIALSLGLCLTFALTRLYRLDLLPVFLDEALHITWASELLVFWRRVMASGKLVPLAAAWTVVGWAPDALLALRVLSAIMGGLGLWSTFLVGRAFFGRATGWVAAFLYALCPFTLFHERVGLADIFLSSFSGAVLATTIGVCRQPSLLRAVGLGLCLALAALSKVFGLVLLGTPVLGLLVLPRVGRFPWKRLAIAYAIALGLVAKPMWVFLRKSAEIGEKAAGDLSGYPQVLVTNLGGAFDVLTAWWSWPLLGLAVVGLAWAARFSPRSALLLGWSVVAPVLSVALTARVWYPRYLLFSTVPALVLAAHGACCLGRLLVGERRSGLARAAAAVLGTAIALPAVRFDVSLLRDPASAPFPAVDRSQYVDGWTSGYGLREASQYLREVLGDRPGITVATPKSEKRTVFLALKTYLRREPRIALREVDPDDSAALAALTGPVVVAAPEGWLPAAFRGRWDQAGPARPIQTFRRPNGAIAVELYLLPDSGE